MTKRPQTYSEAIAELDDAMSEFGRAVRRAMTWRETITWLLIGYLVGVIAISMYQCTSALSLDVPVVESMVLIVGFPRSGTKYLQQVLCSLPNFFIGHEKFFEYTGLEKMNAVSGGVGYNLIGEFGPFNESQKRVRPPIEELSIVAHVVRDPRRVIASCAANLDGRHGISGIEAFEQWWIDYNEQAQMLINAAPDYGCCTFTFRIEHCAEALAQIVSVAQPERVSASAVARRRMLDDAIARTPTTLNTRAKYEKLAWSDLCESTRQLAVSFGYDDSYQQKSARAKAGGK